MLSDTYESVKAVIDFGLVPLLAIPRIVHLTIMTVDVPLLCIVFECTIARLAGERIRIILQSREDSTVGIRFALYESSMIVQTADLGLRRRCSPVRRCEDIYAAEAGEVLLRDARLRTERERQDG